MARLRTDLGDICYGEEEEDEEDEDDYDDDSMCECECGKIQEGSNEHDLHAWHAMHLRFVGDEDDDMGVGGEEIVGSRLCVGVMIMADERARAFRFLLCVLNDVCLHEILSLTWLG